MGIQLFKGEWIPIGDNGFQVFAKAPRIEQQFEIGRCHKKAYAKLSEDNFSGLNEAKKLGEQLNEKHEKLKGLKGKAAQSIQKEINVLSEKANRAMEEYNKMIDQESFDMYQLLVVKYSVHDWQNSPLGDFVKDEDGFVDESILSMLLLNPMLLSQIVGALNDAFNWGAEEKKN